MTEYRPDWYPDPAHRFDLRYHNGTSWTADVATDGDRYVDPIHTADPGDLPTAHDHGRDGHGGGERPRQRNGFSVAALVLGIISLFIAWIPYVVALGAVLAVLAVIFGLIGLRRSSWSDVGRGSSLAGIITGVVGCLAAVGGVFFTIALAHALDDFDRPRPHEVAIEECSGSGGTWTTSGTLTNLDDDIRDYTVSIGFVRPGTDNVQRRSVVEIDDVEPNETRTFDVEVRSALDEVDCQVLRVNGPYPFGVAFD